MKLTERMDWPGGPLELELDLQVLQLVSGSEIRVFSDSYSVDDDEIVFSLGTKNDSGPLHLYSIVSVPLAVVELSPGGWPVFGLEPLAEAGITSPSPPTAAPRPSVRLYSIRLAEMQGHHEDIRIRAHGYRISDNTLWFYFELPRTEEVFDIASISADLLDGAPSEAVAEIGNGPDLLVAFARVPPLGT
ncbi:hypothetical protein [Nocardia xishanensis]|uniref:hypothetical protein n=1 Tax=Nocardia xishanensis TaxID=238964 RepID=UPI00340D3E3A